LLAPIPKEQRKGALPVNRLVVALVANNLWCQVVRGTAQCPRLVRDPLGKAKVSNLQVAVAVQKEVLGFQVSVDDIPLVQVLQGQRDFGGVELGYRIGEALDAVSKTKTLLEEG
jgi:hypothetical protein